MKLLTSFWQPVKQVCSFGLLVFMRVYIHSDNVGTAVAVAV